MTYLKIAFRAALLSSAAAASFAVPGTASAATAAAAATEVTEVVVTGSRIPRLEYDGKIPGVVVGQEEIVRRSFTNALDILNDIPLVGNGTALNTNNGQAASLGVAFVDLLDLGTARTLTLVNGRRFVGGNSATLFVAGNETGNQVDVNSIPTSLLERIDVLTVGGAAAYGSDAISGVINYVMKDRYEGNEASVLGGITSRGDAGLYTFRGLVGRNIGENRGNLAFSFEYNHTDNLDASQRDFRRDNPGGVTNYANGSIRNPNFNPRALISSTNTAFLPTSSDGVPGTTYLSNLRNIQFQHTGVIFNALGSLGTPTAAAVNQIGPASAGFFAGNTQLVGGVPVSCVPDAINICQFAPTSVTAAQAAATFAKYGITPPAGSTQAEQNALAAGILQTYRPTPRDYLAANPNTPLNAFLGTFITSFPDIANPDSTNSAYLARLGVPIRFDAAGNVQAYRVATLSPTTPGTVGGAPGSEGYNTIPFTIIRAKQDRVIGNVFGNFDINDWLTYFTENTLTHVTSVSPRDSGGLASSAASSTVENAALVVNVNNPFLDAADRTALAAAGITNNFILSRSNQDILGDNPATSEQSTLRTVQGLRGKFSAFDRDFNWEASATYGRVKQEIRTGRLRDVEYALALDSTVNPATGQIVCKAQLNPSAYLGTTPPGVVANLIRPKGSDGIATERVFTPVITQSMIDSCQPLNPFGYDQMSAGAKAYLRGDTVFNNTSEQVFLQSFLNGSLFDLPAGPLAFSLAGEYRKESLDFTSNEINNLGRTRSAPSAQTQGDVTTYEYGMELRIPIFGEGLQFPGMQSLEFSPAIRYSRQDGSSPTYRNLAGKLVTQDSKGEFQQIYSLALSYKPIQDITLRGNVTQAIRNPSVTELFLGGQPAFVTPTDPCSNANINAGPVPTLRRANCEKAVIAAGLGANQSAAATFLNSYVSNGRSVQGSFAGSPSLKPESADTITYGIVFEPRFAPSLRMSIDYIQLELKDQIIPTNLTQAMQFCYDSTTFPDTTAQLGSNACNFFVRDGAFQVNDGFASGFLNLSATRLKAYNAAIDYRQNVAALFGSTEDYGNLRLKANVYRLDEFAESSAGDFTDTQNSAGSVTAGRPEWEVSATAVYSKGPFDLSWNTSWTSAQRLYSGGVPATIEQLAILRVEDYMLHNVSVAYELNDNTQIQLTIDNVTDVTSYGAEGRLTAGATGYVDSRGRRFTASLRAKF